MRISDVVNLKVKSGNLEELTIHLKNAKKQNHYFSEKIRSDLQSLIAGNIKTIIESERGEKLTERIAQKVFENALRGTEIEKHCFSFITTQLYDTLIRKWC